MTKGLSVVDEDLGSLQPGLALGFGSFSSDVNLKNSLCLLMAFMCANLLKEGEKRRSQTI